MKKQLLDARFGVEYEVWVRLVASFALSTRAFMQLFDDCNHRPVWAAKGQVHKLATRLDVSVWSVNEAMYWLNRHCEVSDQYVSFKGEYLALFTLNNLAHRRGHNALKNPREKGE
jgi:hypothetical protein